MAGIITVVQSLGLGKLAGARLPIVTGATFVAMSPMILITKDYGLQAMYGSMLLGGVIGIALAWPFASIVRFFPPLVSGSVLTVVGISLIGVAGGLIVGSDPKAATFAAPSRIALAAGVLAIAVLFTVLGRGVWSQLGILIALIVGVAVAAPMGLVKLDGVSKAAWFGAPHPFHFGAPQFPITAVVAMAIVMAVVFAESTASMLAIGEIAGKPLSRGDLARGLVGDGLSAVLGGLLNSFVDTIFNQNVGAVASTRVYSRYVTAVSGAILVLLGLVPRFGALVAAVPQPVIGGVGLMLFATISVIGIDTLRKVDLSDRLNLTLIAVSIGVGLVPVLTKGMFDKFPSSAQILLNSGISLAAATAFTLNLIFNHTGIGDMARGTTKPAPAEPDPETPETVPAT
ncbi:Uric acid permease PucJ [Nocardia seriolae]|uniref:Purine permease n=1 Tax=Nocardia seriolae TaxID=37332 RepID=A0ABC9YPW2_9NOCA|nr:Uric acid permease PucJ [Nocardia seriolae]GEM23069.1 xanthine/uracil permease [Nocardia seriolae NBRC 15557]BEK86200.1 nucleobase:cation symporter-2 family protein [Nocardia seriolae]BEK97867.1 nucleobase:cation symporter-2 family protein [Nocardia seriolae]GAM45449.1 purine permease [Nocardia seriolae]